MSYFYLSFLDTSLPYREEDDYPGGPRWLGGCYVRATHFMEAVNAAWTHGCNPGGEVKGWGPLPEGAVAESMLNRLLTAEELDAGSPDE